MREGDLVRFAKWQEVDIRDSRAWPSEPKPHIGTLVKHDKLMGAVYVLCEGEVHKVRPVFVEKAGKKDTGFNPCEACGCDPCDCGFGSY